MLHLENNYFQVTSVVLKCASFKIFFFCVDMYLGSEEFDPIGLIILDQSCKLEQNEAKVTDGE